VNDGEERGSPSGVLWPVVADPEAKLKTTLTPTAALLVDAPDASGQIDQPWRTIRGAPIKDVESRMGTNLGNPGCVCARG
jgi:hypothetical protein